MSEETNNTYVLILLLDSFRGHNKKCKKKILIFMYKNG